MGVHNKVIYVHRFSYSLHYGVDIGSKFVRHDCDNRICVNPDHLSVGSHADNMLDMTSRGRQSKGEHRHTSKLTEANVRDIRDRAAKGIAIGILAEEYKVGFSAVKCVVDRKTWKHVA